MIYYYEPVPDNVRAPEKCQTFFADNNLSRLESEPEFSYSRPAQCVFSKTDKNLYFKSSPLKMLKKISLSMGLET